MGNIGGINLCAGLSQFASYSKDSLKIINRVETNANPFEISNATYTKVLDVAAYRVTQLNEQAKAQIFGVTSDAIYRVTIRKTEQQILPNAFAVVVSDVHPTIEGVVLRVDYNDLGLMQIFVNTSVVFPGEVLQVL